MNENTICSEVKKEAQHKYQDVVEKIDDLQHSKATPIGFAGEGPKGACPILEALEGESETGKNLR